MKVYIPQEGQRFWLLCKCTEVKDDWGQGTWIGFDIVNKEYQDDNVIRHHGWVGGDEERGKHAIMKPVDAAICDEGEN